MISLVRVDNRLIHGQVVEAWLPHLKVSRVVVADDEAASSPLVRAAMSLAAASGPTTDRPPRWYPPHPRLAPIAPVGGGPGGAVVPRSADPTGVVGGWLWPWAAWAMI